MHRRLATKHSERCTQHRESKIQITRIFTKLTHMDEIDKQIREQNEWLSESNFEVANHYSVNTSRGTYLNLIVNSSLELQKTLCFLELLCLPQTHKLTNHPTKRWRSASKAYKTVIENARMILCGLWFHLQSQSGTPKLIFWGLMQFVDDRKAPVSCTQIESLAFVRLSQFVCTKRENNFLIQTRDKCRDKLTLNRKIIASFVVVVVVDFSHKISNSICLPIQRNTIEMRWN